MNEHQIVIFSGGVEIKGAVEVEGFSEKEIKIEIVDKRRVFICGDGLKIVHFSKQTGELSASGKINSIKYSGSSEKLFKRLFK